MAIRVIPAPAEHADKWEVQLRKGCLELAILAALWSERLYGLEIMRRLASGSGLNDPSAHGRWFSLLQFDFLLFTLYSPA
jgi:hypothetical protein